MFTVFGKQTSHEDDTVAGAYGRTPLHENDTHFHFTRAKAQPFKLCTSPLYCCNANSASGRFTATVLKLCLLFVLFTIGLQNVLAQTISAQREAGVLYVSLSDVAKQLGYTVTEASGSLTIRFTGTVLTVFANSPDITFNGLDDTLSSSVFTRSGDWFAPDDALSFLGVALENESLVLPNGYTSSLEFPKTRTTFGSSRWSQVDLGNSVTGVSFFMPGSAGDETVSILMLDFKLLALVFPDQQKALDAVSSKFTKGKPIYFLVTALADASWESSFTLEQDGKVLQYQSPGSLSLLEGDPTTVTLSTPVSGVLVLPDWVDLRSPITVTWSGITASVQFRR
ncbi:MAG: hypothetical protein ACRCYY_19520 [Trueperaceae bacterium]